MMLNAYWIEIRNSRFHRPPGPDNAVSLTRHGPPTVDGNYDHHGIVQIDPAHTPSAAWAARDGRLIPAM